MFRQPQCMAQHLLNFLSIFSLSTSNRPEAFCKNAVSQGNTCHRVLLQKTCRLISCNSSIIGLCHRYFSVNLYQILTGQVLLYFLCLQNISLLQFSARYFVPCLTLTLSSLSLSQPIKMEIPVLFMQVFLLFANIMVPFLSNTEILLILFQLLRNPTKKMLILPKAL